MSGADDSKPAEHGGDHWNPMAIDNGSKCRWKSQSPGKATLITTVLQV